VGKPAGAATSLFVPVKSRLQAYGGALSLLRTIGRSRKLCASCAEVIDPNAGDEVRRFTSVQTNLGHLRSTVMKKVAVEKHAWSFTALIVAVSACAVSATGQIGKQEATIQTNTDTSPNQPQLFRDGKPWIPHGVQMVAFVQTPDFAACADNPTTTTCNKVYEQEVTNNPNCSEN
jgi:hypothetical protein